MKNEEIIKILNNDKDFQLYLNEKNVERFMKFVNLPITKIIKTEKDFKITTKIKKIIKKKINEEIVEEINEEIVEFILINMDNFYLKNKNRKKTQFNILETFEFTENIGLEI